MARSASDSMHYMLLLYCRSARGGNLQYKLYSLPTAQRLQYASTALQLQELKYERTRLSRRARPIIISAHNRQPAIEMPGYRAVRTCPPLLPRLSSPKDHIGADEGRSSKNAREFLQGRAANTCEEDELPPRR